MNTLENECRLCLRVGCDHLIRGSIFASARDDGPPISMIRQWSTWDRDITAEVYLPVEAMVKEDLVVSPLFR